MMFRLILGSADRIRSRFKSFFLLTESPGRNTAMEGLRGYAVLLVVFIHAVGHVLVAHRHVNVFDAESQPFWTLARLHSASDAMLLALMQGHYAVDLFFLLSAFLITRIVVKQQAHFSYRRYLTKRFLRIYPPFFVSLLVCMGVQILWLQTMPYSTRTFLKNLLFLHGCPIIGYRVAAYNFPTWSLFYEFSFYLVFPMLFMLLGRSQKGTGTGSFMSSILLFGAVLWSHAYMPRSCTFFFGMMIGLRNDDELGRIARGLSTRVVVTVYLALVVAYAFVSRNWSWYSPFFSVGATMLFLKTCYDSGPLNRFFSSMPLRWIGNISFSLYLMHRITLDIIEHSLDPQALGLHPLLDAGVYFVLSLGLSLVLAVALFATVERWHFRKAQRPLAPHESPEMPGEVLPRLAA